MLLCGYGSLKATMVPRLSLEEMVGRSELIVQGGCLRTWTAWDAQTRFVWTHNEIQVTDALKGGRSAVVVVSEPGGPLGEIEVSIEGMPRYQPGEEVVLFLYRTPIGFLRSRGLGQGKYKVQADALSGERRLQGELGGVAVVEAAGAARATRTDLRQFDGARLEEFKSLVRELVTRGAMGKSQ